MTDLRKSGGFRLKDRFEGFDLDHYKLVVEAQATLHAFSWAYKCKTGTNFSRKFPFLNINGFANMMEQGGFEFFKANLRTSEGIVKDDPVLVDGVNHLSSVFMPAAKLYFNMELKEDEKQYTKDNVLRKPGPVVENEGNTLSQIFEFMSPPWKNHSGVILMQSHGKYCYTVIRGATTCCSGMIKLRASL